MKFLVVKRLAPAVLALGIAASGVGLTAGTAFASSKTAAKVGASLLEGRQGQDREGRKDGIGLQRREGQVQVGEEVIAP